MFSNYSSESTFHSLNYIGSQNINWKSRIFWIIVFIIATTLCVYINIENYEKWKNRPIIVTFDESPTHISEIPFPAVTICKNFYREDFCSLYPLQQRDGEVVNCEHTSDQEKNETDTEAKAVALKFVCPNFRLYTYGIWSVGKGINIVEDSIVTFNDDDEIYNNTSALTLINALKELHLFQYYDKIVGHFGKQIDEIQSRITLTGEGICRTFNMIYAEDLFKFNISDAFIDHEKEDEFESRYRSTQFYDHVDYSNVNREVNSSGIEYGLSFSVDDKNVTNKCHEDSHYKIEIHSPYDYPQPEINGFEISTDVDTKFILKPSITKASLEVRGYPIDVRKCVFEDEVDLKFFQHYTKSNCELECKIEYIFTNCNCTLYFMPHVENAKICVTFDDFECYKNKNSEFNPKTANGCNCLPLCNIINYKYDASSTSTSSTR